ncbi:MAG: threonine synthase [Steroidobacteraceae bacterium]
MKYRSTRSDPREVSLSEAMREGLAPDGGLYVPAGLPRAQARGGETTLAGVAVPLLAPFFAGDPLERELAGIVDEAFVFPTPLRAVEAHGGPLSVLELFHGPTAAFKDLGARFLAACLARATPGSSRPLTIIVATSGDTGGAVAAALHRRPGFRVVLLYPAGRVAPLQERQLCCWDDNVTTCAVQGSFDDCQRLAKQAFADPALQAALSMSSANSINIGRLLPQIVSFAAASLQVEAAGGRPAGFIIPSGNLGHALACVWAREMGLPIGGIVLAHNANRTVPDYVESGQWRPRPSIATIANAMDVGDPSNMERIFHLYRDHKTLTARISATSIDDDAIRNRIRAEASQASWIPCPHTAVAAEAWHRMPEPERRRLHWIVVATAHPAKFPEVVEPLVGSALTPPPALAQLLGRPLRRTEIAADLDALRALLVAA